MAEIVIRAHKNCPRAWAARLVGTNPEGQEVQVSRPFCLEDGRETGAKTVKVVKTPFEREFLQPDRDDRSKAGSGNLYFEVESGYYETHDVLSSTRCQMSRRYWRVVGEEVEQIGKAKTIEELSKAEANPCLH